MHYFYQYYTPFVKKTITFAQVFLHHFGYELKKQQQHTR